jgi:hypothetical protein
MGRVINTDSTGKQRNQALRSVAELLRRLSQKTEFDDEAKDMVATLVFCFREIEDGIDSSAAAWEKRDYWMKADELRTRWDWVSRMKDQLQTIAFNENWDQLPPIFVKLLPYVSDIKITKMTRKEDLWMGNYARLMREKPVR